MGDSVSPLKLKKVTKKRSVSIDNGKCFMYQMIYVIQVMLVRRRLLNHKL